MQGNAVCTFMHDQGLLFSWGAPLPTQEKSPSTSTSPHTLKLPWTQSHPQGSSRTTQKSSWGMHRTSFVYWYQTAWLRWSKPIPLTLWIVPATQRRKGCRHLHIYSKIHVMGRSMLVGVLVRGVLSQFILNATDNVAILSSCLLRLGLFPPKSWEWG